MTNISNSDLGTKLIRICKTLMLAWNCCYLRVLTFETIRTNCVIYH